MTLHLSYLSVCSGIEAATAAWRPLGWQPVAFSEIEPFPSAVLQHHYPDTPNYGDMTLLPDMILNGEIEAPDVLVGGTPCQSFSVAGMRAGLSDDRGALTIKFVELADAIDTIRLSSNRPESIIVWENVPGVLSSKDNAFGCFLAALAGEDEELKPTGKRWSNAGFVLGPQRAIAWRILDAQYFGVAQRRRRVFVVASARDGFCPAEVLFEFDGLRRDIAPSRSEEQSVTADARESAKRAGSHGELVGALCASDHKGVVNQVAAYGIPGNWIGRKPENGGNSTQFMNEVSPAQTATDKHGVVTLAPEQPQCWRVYGTDGVSPAMQSGEGRGNAIFQASQVRRLTPIECERLQGFPDNYTQIPWRNKPADECPDGHRYKALGNSMAVPVMRWIGQRIQKTLKHNEIEPI